MIKQDQRVSEVSQMARSREKYTEDMDVFVIKNCIQKKFLRK